jgi:hypothetical protein
MPTPEISRDRSPSPRALHFILIALAVVFLWFPADLSAQFEGRTYSVPYPLLGRRLEVRGGAGVVQIFAGTELVAQHPRQTRRRLVLDPAHYEGPPGDRVQAPTPLGRMGRRLQEIAAMAPQQRPVDLYAALAEVAR